MEAKHRYSYQIGDWVRTCDRISGTKSSPVPQKKIEKRLQSSNDSLGLDTDRTVREGFENLDSASDWTINLILAEIARLWIVLPTNENHSTAPSNVHSP